MKIEQDATFNPIVLTLETSREAQMMWDAVLAYKQKGPVEIKFFTELSDWFSTCAKLGGNSRCP